MAGILSRPPPFALILVAGSRALLTARDLRSDAGITVVTLATGSRTDIPAAPVHGQDPAAADFAHGFTIAVCCTAEISLHRRDKHSIGIIEKQFKMKRVALYSIGLHISKLQK